ncbi:unnamed protein product [Rhizophagus irregularis]|nr:unnamed protein product [Rhizophagus irregularis]
MGKVNRKHFDDNNSQKKRKTLTFNQKKELCEKHHDQNLSGVQLAKEYEISDSAVSDILKKSEYWLSIDSTLQNANRFREKTCNYPQIEEALSIWIDQQISRDLTLSGPIIQEKAKEFAILFNIDNFLASGGWLSNFKRRNNLHTFKIRGEAGSAPVSEIPQMRAELQAILQEYEPRDIWNCDETALFWRLLPSKTIAHSSVIGKKCPKERAYDLYDEDQNPPPIDILDSINLIAEAWKMVTKKTIINSWDKAGILPNDESNTSDDDDSEIEDDSEDLQLLINRLPITDPLNMEEYINIDDEIITEEELTSEEIVNIVRGQSAVEKHVEEEDETVAASGALNSIEKLIRYVRQNDLGIDNSDMQNLLKLKKKIISDSKKKLKQGRIDDFF